MSVIITILKYRKALYIVAAILLLITICFQIFEWGRKFERNRVLEDQLETIIKQSQANHKRAVELNKALTALEKERAKSRKEISKLRIDLQTREIPACKVEQDVIEDLNKVIRRVNRG